LLRQKWMLLCCIGWLAACGGGQKGGPDGLEGPRGAVQGILVNALTGERIPVPSLSQSEGVRVVTGHTYKSAVRLTDVKETAHQMVGEFYVPQVPVNKRYPIVAQVEGYQPFEGYIEIPAKYTKRTVIGRTGEPMEVEVVEENPHMLANIRLYPLGTEAQDLEIQVVQSGDVVKDAVVQLKPVLENKLDDSDGEHVELRRSKVLVDERNFVLPYDTRLQSLRATTDEKGKVSFDKDQLVLGGVYKLLVMPAQGMAQPSIYEETVTVGLRHPAMSLSPDRYQIIVSLSAMKLQTKAIGTNVQRLGYHQDGRLSVRFNRPVALTKASVEAMYATLSNAVWATLPKNEPNVGGPETMDFSVDGDTLTLMPKFLRAPDLEWETGLAVTYHNVYVLALDEPYGVAIKLEDLLREAGLGEHSVKFVGNAQPRPAPASLTMTMSSGRQIQARLMSPFGPAGQVGSYPFENGLVEITARKGTLVLLAGSERLEGSSFSLHTDSSGYTTKYRHADGSFSAASLRWEATDEENPGSYDIVAKDGLGKLTPVNLAQ